MALDFGKLDFNVAFNPTYAFPIDARCYFESKTLAEAAAATAIMAGGAESKYYFGQTIVVVENNTATLYTIQPDGTLAEVGAKLEIDTNCFATDETGKLSLLGFAGAVEGAQLVVGADGKINWVKPDTTTVEGLSTAVANLEKAILNVYTKEETDTHIAAAVSNAAHMKRMVLADKDAIIAFAQANPNTYDQYIFMIPTGLIEDDDKYDEYLVIAETVVGEDEVETISYKAEKIGSWEVDLTSYAKTSEVEKLLEGKVDVDENARLITLDEAEKLAGLHNAPFDTLSEDFEVVEAELTLKDLAISKVTGLQDALDDKVTAVEGERLMTDAEGEKLEGIEEGAEANYIKSTTTSFEVSEDGQLSLKAVPTTIDLSANETIAPLITTVTNLDNLVNGTEESDGLNSRVGQLETSLSTLGDTVGGLETAVGTLETTVGNHGTAIEGINNSISELDTAVGNLEELINGLGDTYLTIATYDAQVGDITQLVHVSEKANATIVDEINDINERLAWGELEE